MRPSCATTWPISLAVDLATFRLSVSGAVATPLSLSLAELKALGEPVEVVAVNQGSGKSRGYSLRRVFGAQLATARWAMRAGSACR